MDENRIEQCVCVCPSSLPLSFILPSLFWPLIEYSLKKKIFLPSARSRCTLNPAPRPSCTVGVSTACEPVLACVLHWTLDTVCKINIVFSAGQAPAWANRFLYCFLILKHCEALISLKHHTAWWGGIESRQHQKGGNLRLIHVWKHQ